MLCGGKNGMFKCRRRTNQVQEQTAFSKSQVMAALQAAEKEGQVDYILSTFIRYLLAQGRSLTIKQARAIGLSVPASGGEDAGQKMIRIRDDDRRR